MPNVIELKIVNLGTPPLRPAFLCDRKPCSEHMKSPLLGKLPRSVVLNESLGQCANCSRQYQCNMAHYLLHVHPSVWAVPVLNSSHGLPFLCLHAQSFTLVWLAFSQGDNNHCPFSIIRLILAHLYVVQHWHFYQGLQKFLLHCRGSVDFFLNE